MIGGVFHCASGNLDQGRKMDTHLSAAALAVLHHYLATNANRVNKSNREAYRELAAAGFMIPLHTPLRRSQLTG
jgi:hypothetical protein